MNRIAILTSGGDAPGMNAAIRAATRTAIDRGAAVFGARQGYAGLMAGDFVHLSARDVGGLIERGGTFLGSARCPEFKTDCGLARAVSSIKAHEIDGLIVIGGDGSQAGARDLARLGVSVNGVASTIDNDLYASDLTIGVDTALNIALESIDRLRTTASSHHRLFIVEVMGRNCGYLALTAGLAGGAEAIVMPEYDLAPDAVIERIHEARRRRKRHAIVVVAEGARNNAHALYDAVRKDEKAGFDPRLTILGHVQRGGSPGAFDRLLATRLAAKAVELLFERKSGCLIGLLNGHPTPTPLEEVIGKIKPLPEDLLTLAETMQL